jgi:hypothetical protein
MEYSEKEIERALMEIQERGGPNRSPIPKSSLMLQVEDQFYECGTVFEAETVKGGKNYVLFMRTHKDPKDQREWVIYAHGDKMKKVYKEHFVKMICYGDLSFVPREKVDPERIALCVLGLNANANGLAFNDYMKVIFGYGAGSEARATL